MSVHPEGTVADRLDNSGCHSRRMRGFTTPLLAVMLAAMSLFSPAAFAPRRPG